MLIIYTNTNFYSTNKFTWSCQKFTFIKNQMFENQSNHQTPLINNFTFLINDHTIIFLDFTSYFMISNYLKMYVSDD